MAAGQGATEKPTKENQPTQICVFGVCVCVCMFVCVCVCVWGVCVCVYVCVCVCVFGVCVCVRVFVSIVPARRGSELIRMQLVLGSNGIHVPALRIQNRNYK